MTQTQTQIRLFPDLPIELFPEAEAPEKKSASKYQIWKQENNYRKAVNHNIDGKMCAKCKHLLKDTGHSVVYYKCELLGTSHSSATDVRISYVCDRFEGEI